MGDNTKRVEEKKEGTEALKKPTYEELKNYCNQLLMQRNQIAERLNEITNIVNKLPWLFEVVKNASAFDSSFVKACVNEIENILTPPEDSKETEDNK